MAYQPKNVNGQATMAGSTPVVVASDQSAIPVSGTVTANLGTLAAPLTTIGAGAAATALRTHLSDESLAALENITVISSGTVTATLAAETTKVIGTVNQGTSPWVVSGTVTATTGGLTDTQLRATPVPVSGTVTANISGSISNTTFAVTQATGTNLHTVVDSGTITNLSQLGGVAVSLNTGVRDAGTQRVTIATNDVVPVTGTFWQATQPVSGTFWQATQPVSGSITATLAAETTKVIGTVNQGTSPWVVSGTVTATTGGLTDTQLRATPVPVSGAVTVSGTATVSQATGTNLHTVVDSGTVTTVSTVTNLAQLGGAAVSMNTGIRDAGTQRVTIATNDSVPVTFTGSTDVATQTTLSALNTKVTACNTGAVVLSSGTVTTVSTVTNLAQLGGTAVSMNTGVRDAGTQRVTIATNDVVPVSGTFWQATQPVSGAITATLSAETTKVIGTVNQGTSPWVVSGTVTATTGGLTDTQLRATPVPISGTVTANISGSISNTTFTATQATGTNLHTVVDSGTVTTVSTVTNVSQNGGVAISLNTGVRDTGTRRVTIATDDVVQTKNTPDATATYAPTTSTSTAYETSRIAKASAGVLYAVTGYNSSASAQFIQLHNTATLPADAAVPVMMFTVPASSNFSLDFGGWGRYCSAGITLCNSSTGPTKTIGAANCWFDVLYK